MHHRLQFEDEGNAILRSWESQSYGRETSARYLGLYDGSPWHQNFLREGKSHGDDESQRHIEQATLSLCLQYVLSKTGKPTPSRTSERTHASPLKL
jgi:hypothetical protein